MRALATATLRQLHVTVRTTPFRCFAAPHKRYQCTQSDVDQFHLERALELAVGNVDEQGRGAPFGAVIGNATGAIVSEAANAVISDGPDPTAHAEVTAIRKACRKLGQETLTGCTLYSSCEPCPMCFGAIYWANISRVIYSATRRDAHHAGFDDQFIYEEIKMHAECRGTQRISFEHKSSEQRWKPFERWLAMHSKQT